MSRRQPRRRVHRILHRKISLQSFKPYADGRPAAIDLIATRPGDLYPPSSARRKQRRHN